MKVKIIFLTIIFSLFVISCGDNIDNSSIYAFPEPPTEITVTYYSDATGVVTYDIKDFNSVMNWYYNLELVEKKSEPEPVEGNNPFEVKVDRKDAFTYDNRGDNAYLYVDNKIFKVKNPSNPPMESAEGIDPASIGIIGGADGPTAIIVTGNFDGGPWMILIGSIIIAVIGVVRLVKNKKKKTIR